MTILTRPKHHGRANAYHILMVAWLVLSPIIFLGCGPKTPSATVEGTLRLNGQPLDNCLIIFFPKDVQGSKSPHSTGLTDRQGHYHLRFANQQEGVAPGGHCIVIQDMSVSTGVRRRDHGTVDAGPEQTTAVTPVRRSRVPETYTSAATTPLSKEVKPGHQVIDLDIP